MGSSGWLKNSEKMCARRDRERLVDNECAPHSVRQLFHHEIPLLCFISPLTMHIETSTISLLPNWPCFIPHSHSFYCHSDIARLVEISKISKVQWIILFLQRTWSFWFSPFFDLWHSIRAAKDFNARSCEKTRRAEHHDPYFHLLDSTRVLECYEKGKVFYIYCMRQRVRV